MTTVFTASLATETNTFSPITTGEGAFRETVYYEAGTAPVDAPIAFAAPLYVANRRAAAEGWTVKQGLIAFAQPGSVTPRYVYESLRDQLLADLREAMPVHMVALGLHGGMVADGYDDCEGDLLARVRQIVGPQVPVGAELDPHCHLTDTMVRNADILVCFKENPHTDVLERAEDLITLLARMMKGGIRPVRALYDCGMFDFLNTRLPPMRGIVDDMLAREDGREVLSISVAHGFARADVPDMGSKVLVITDGQPELATRVAREFGERLWAQRGQSRPAFVLLDQAIERALAVTHGPIVLADAADNPGGGAPSDSTFIVKALLDRGIQDFAAALIWDPQAVAFAVDAGEGARLPMRIGGKACSSSGPPLDLDVVVERIRTDGYQRLGKAAAPLGTAVAVRVGDAVLVLTTLRNQVFTTDVFTELGIDPTARRILVVKSSQHFRASFEPIAREIMVVSTPGVCDLDIGSFEYRRIQRPKWPFDAERGAARVELVV